MRVMLCNAAPTDAERLAETLVREELAACVNVVPGVQSWYRWQGGVVTDPECTLILKVAEDRLETCRQRLVELHPYDVPEVLALPIDEAASHTPYVLWVEGGGG